MTTIWQQESPTQTDYDTIATDALLQLSDDDDEAILFHTWVFVDAETEWTEDPTF